jgi:hypothetical protein
MKSKTEVLATIKVMHDDSYEARMEANNRDYLQKLKDPQRWALQKQQELDTKEAEAKAGAKRARL